MILPDVLYKAAFSQTRSAMIILNDQGIPVLWNEAFDELFIELAGFVPDKLSVPLFDWLQERDSFQYSYYITEVLLGHMGAASMETSLRTVSGGRLWLRTTMSLIRTEDETRPAEDSSRWIWCSFQNISDQKQRERELVSAKEEAEKATMTKSQFLANMSHEIRTPIQTILGMMELLHETSLDKEQIDYLRSVQFSADVLLGLINDVLDFSKIEAGKFELENADFDLHATLRQAVVLIILDAHKKGLEVVIDLDPQLPRFVRGDPGRLRQIVVNMFKNAVKFTQTGEIIIKATVLFRNSAVIMRVEVQDTGPGVPLLLRDKLFTPFTQANAGALTHGGTGLGLAISRHLVSMMGGTVFYRPVEPRGSVFGFEITLNQAEYSMPQGQQRIATCDKVLIVDDNAAASDFAVKTAAMFGLQPHAVSSGTQALAALREAALAGTPYALCLIDQNMPEMDGWRLAAEITAERLINSVQLILMAPEGAIGSEAKMKLLKWFNGYLVKPLNPQDLFQTINSVLTESVELDAVDEDEGSAALKPENANIGLTVLLAEDHIVNQELFSILLSKLGCSTDLASDGTAAVEMAKQRDYDLVLMDIFMPRMDGYEASRHLREQGFSKPIIAVTASALKGEREKCVEAGMNDILIKPFKRKDLETMLRFWANKTLNMDGENEAPSSVSERHLWDNTVFDLPGLIETFLGQRETVLSLVKRFIDKTRSQLPELHNAAMSGDTKTMREIAHSIKGASWNMTAKQLGDMAFEIESASKQDDLEGARSLLPKLAICVSDFEQCAAYQQEAAQQ